MSALAGSARRGRISAARACELVEASSFQSSGAIGISGIVTPRSCALDFKVLEILRIKEYKGMMPSSRRRVSERGIVFRKEAKLLEPARLIRMWLTSHTSKFTAVTASPVGDMLRDQICTNSGVEMLDNKSYLVLGAGWVRDLKGW